MAPKSTEKENWSLNTSRFKFDSEEFSHPSCKNYFTKEGLIEASTGSLLYLAYLYAKESQYEIAHQILEYAKLSAIDSIEDKNLFKTVFELFQMEEPVSQKSLAFQLEVENLLSNTERDQLGIKFFDPMNQTPYFNRVSRLAQLYGKFNILQKNNSPLNLSKETENWLRNCQAESLSLLLEQSSEGLTRLTPLSLKKVTPSEITKEVLVHIAAFSTIRPIDSTDPLPEIPVPLTIHFLLTHFVTYYNAIVNNSERVTEDTILSLFNPLTKTPCNRQTCLSSGGCMSETPHSSLFSKTK